jgi:phosphohistidine phosphatase
MEYSRRLIESMELYILRHGIAEDTSRSGRDRDRELTAEGVEKSRATGQALRKLGVKFDLILSSPYARAWATAEIVAEEMDCRSLLKECPALASGQPTGGVLAELQKVARTHESVLLAGHEPDLSELISTLLSGSPRLGIAMKKGGLCKMTLHSPEPGAAIMNWLVTSKLLERMA